MMQPLARMRAPERCAGLFFFDFSLSRNRSAAFATAGSTGRDLVSILQPDGVGAAALVGACAGEHARAYIGHFLRHWSHREDAFDDVFEAFVDNVHETPGNLVGRLRPLPRRRMHRPDRDA